MGRKVHQFAIEPEDEAEQPIAKTHSTLHDRVEHRLSIGRRARDDAKVLTRCRLLLEGLGYLCVGLRERTIFLLEFSEEAHVLDRDDRLVGEGLEQGNLGISKGAYFGAQDRETAQRLALAQQRN